MDPTLAGFLQFVTAQGISANALPANSPWPGYAYGVAVELVNQTLQQASPLTYMLAVYNLAMHNLVEFCPDSGIGTPPDTTFSTLRAKLDINGPIFGTVTSTSDEGTSVSVEAPDFIKQLSLSDLTYLKTPWGRQYVAFAQRVGSLWGLD